MFRPEGDRRSFSITREITVVGRREDCDFRIPLGEISRKHCRLIKDGESLRIEDLGSSNGTYHNGVRVQEATLAPGDTLQIGSVVFAVQIDGVPDDDDLQPIVGGPSEAHEAHSVETAPMVEDTPTISQVPDSGEFDPMSVLDNNDSGVAHESVVIDLEESRHDGSM